ncbi:radical SAM protein [Thermoanaerobacterium sp. CMT5567-10]|jgi:Radical SAM superfamily.|uniref:radical SAM/SPASM domain-containing protein n=1 Tax=Thermoanaerobacterium sp. CMT5567-10 TaxID=3061989 RepID=UPI0026E0BB6A|nr:radical SAM protein [Thermoanaerobacterium sp. CMT5567-10]WKV09984.1 radical SAM protein [Thermoanaerobacterium sp. CMT5567-10]
MIYHFSKYTQIVENNNKVVLGNRLNGEWIRISREVYNILEMGIKNKLSISELINCLYDNDDKNYLKSLYKNMCMLGIIEDDTHQNIAYNKLVSFEMTHRCNLHCIHCCVSADTLNSKDKDLSTEICKDIINKMSKWNPKSIMLSGGEPMVRTDFFELLLYLKSIYNGNIILSTNGLLIGEENVDILTKCVTSMSISLDGADEESCSMIRGHGVFNKVIKNIQLLKKNNFKRISVSMTISPKTEHLEGKFYELNKSLGTTPLIRDFSPVGRGRDNYLAFTDDGLDKVFISKKFLSDDYSKPIGVSSCGAGTRELLIRYNGDIYPCMSLSSQKFKLGSVLEIKSLSEVVKKTMDFIDFNTVLQSLDYKYKQRCKQCKVNLFCWTCPGSFQEYKGNIKAFEDRCNKLKPILYKRVWGSE